MVCHVPASPVLVFTSFFTTQSLCTSRSIHLFMHISLTLTFSLLDDIPSLCIGNPITLSSHSNPHPPFSLDPRLLSLSSASTSNANSPITPHPEVAGMPLLCYYLSSSHCPHRTVHTISCWHQMYVVFLPVLLCPSFSNLFSAHDHAFGRITVFLFACCPLFMSGFRFLRCSIRHFII